jgi:hypothetical protein
MRARTRADAEVDVFHSAAAPRRFGTKSRRLSNRPPFECIALLLQGGGALGSYQAGVYEALAEANLHPDWVAGISSGAINSAIMAGNPPTERVSKLRGFWEEITANPLLDWAGALRDCLSGDFTRGFSTRSAQTGPCLRAPPGFSHSASRPLGCTPRVPSRQPAFTIPSGSGARLAFRRLRAYQFRRDAAECRGRQRAQRQFRLFRYYDTRDLPDEASREMSMREAPEENVIALDDHSREWMRLLCKLRWIGLEEEARPSGSSHKQVARMSEAKSGAVLEGTDPG